MMHSKKRETGRPQGGPAKAFVEWSDRYLTRIPLIDNDHQTLFTTVNLLHDRSAENADHDIISRALDVLVMYVDRHFAREEALLERNAYPDLIAHMAAHRRISAKVQGFKTAFDENPDTIDMAPFLDFLGEWLTSHILHDDMAYIAHINVAAES